MKPLQNYIEEIEKQFDEKFGFEEIQVCKKCGHNKESHYWNGGGIIEYSGYDACRVNGCNCKCLSEDYDVKKIPANQEFKQFLSQSLHRIAEITAREIMPEPSSPPAFYETSSQKEKKVITKPFPTSKLK